MLRNRLLVLFGATLLLATAALASDDDTCSGACDTYGHGKQSSGNADFKEGFQQTTGAVFHGAGGAIFCGCAYSKPPGARACVNAGGVEVSMSSCQNAPKPQQAADTDDSDGQPSQAAQVLAAPNAVDFGTPAKGASGTSGAPGE